MKQILQSYRTGELWLADVPAPACPANGTCVLVHCSLVSAGTEKRMLDLAKANLLRKALDRPDQVRRIIQKVKVEGLFATWQQVNAKLDVPVPMGYSACGQVIEVGLDAAEFRVGQRVACAGVGYASHAEVITVPRTLAVPLPEGIDYEQGCFGTLGAIAMQAVRQADVRVGELVGVIGLGLLGNLVAQILHAAGARVVGTDLDAGRRDLAVQLGVELAGTDIATLSGQVSGGRGLDAIIIAAGAKDSSILQACPAALRHRGRVVVLGFVGMDCPHQEFYNKELELKMSMSYGPGRYDPVYEAKGQDYPYAFVRWTEQRNLESFLHLVARKQVDVRRLITHRFAFENALGAYTLMEKSEPYLGIVLNYDPRPEAQERQMRVRAAVVDTTAPLRKLAVIGAGNFVTGTLCPVLRRLRIPIRSVTTQHGATATHGAERLGAEIATTDLAASLTDPDVSHVLIATRHADHASQAEAALRAGKRIHVEKPLCVTRDALLRLDALVAELRAEGRIQVGFNRRYSPLSVRLKAALQQQAGTPLTILYRINAGVLDENHRFFGDPGGRLTAEGCHFLDFCNFLTGQPADRVACTAQGRTGRPFDSFIVALGYPDGSQATIVYSGQGDRSLRKERIEVYQGRRCWVNDDWMSLVCFSDGKARKLYAGRQNKGWQEEMEHFLGIAPHPQAPTWGEICAVHECMFNAISAALGASQPNGR